MRCSGPRAREVAARVFRSAQPLRDRVATYGEILDVNGAVVDRGLALAMDAPRTATGEDVVELHVHGSPVVARETLRALLHAGARAAGPGEFTRRAFLNGKLDLSAAEAVADVVEAETSAAARAAQANLAGALRAHVDRARGVLAAILEELAGAIDYPDEVPEPPREALAARIAGVDDALAALVRDWERGRLVREGLSLAIVGPPNAGKSSLLNALLEEERAIVSEIPGTTRDVIEERFVVDGVAVRVLDTAGLRTSDDPVERIGIERARRALEDAALALVVVDGSRPLGGDAVDLLRATRGRARVVLFNKADLGRAAFDARDDDERDALLGSALWRHTVDAVRRAIAAAGWDGEAIDLSRPHLASAHQADAVARAREALDEARATLAAGEPIDLVAPALLGAVA
ncbi:MAG: tRNA uridine-5-carboxymethylaminomethyl(34) synthesis GTPase MnmE, partial [Candidatus Eremiobacteraeota bacterium]|nr:tRNA uridine-5-carboxymethylaminomethyl(34) synthesis GTPase MnmE [Candidatus Eremiobacteraeota bacterium]